MKHQGQTTSETMSICSVFSLMSKTSFNRQGVKTPENHKATVQFVTCHSSPVTAFLPVLELLPQFSLQHLARRGARYLGREYESVG